MSNRALELQQINFITPYNTEQKIYIYTLRSNISNVQNVFMWYLIL